MIIIIIIITIIIIIIIIIIVIITIVILSPSPGSVVATLVLMFDSSVSEPLKPLQDEIADSKLGQFTVGRQLFIFQPNLPPTTPPSTGAGILILQLACVYR